MAHHGSPTRIVIDGSQTNHEVIKVCDTTDRLRRPVKEPTTCIQIRNSKYLNNRIAQDHRRVNKRMRPMLGFKAFHNACSIINGIELISMMRKQQGRYAFNPSPTLKQQFQLLAA